jgi:hypothetical protein
MKGFFFITLIISGYLAINNQNCAYTEYRPISGYCSNVDNPSYGTPNQPFYPILGYYDRFSDNLPNERTLSNHLYYLETSPINNHKISMAEVFFGQFINHDQESNQEDAEREKYHIKIEEVNDQFLDAHPGLVYLNMSYSKVFNDSLPFSVANLQTSYLDLSTVYGFNENMTNALRANVSGLLLSKDYVVCAYDGIPPPFGSAGCSDHTVTIYDLPPSEKMTGLKNQLGFNEFGQDRDYLLSVGDVRGNENIALSTMHTAFFREHNRNARKFAAEHPEWDDEKLFQEARKLTIAIYQHIIYDEYLPTIIGNNYFKMIFNNYTGFNSSLNPGTSHIFSVAAFRYGHSSLRLYNCLDDAGCPIACIPSWVPFFWNIPQYIMPILGSLGPTGFTIPDLIANIGGFKNLIYSLVYQKAGDIDNIIDNSFRNLGKGFIPLDISAADIARGRMNGLPDYHTVRAYYFRTIYGEPGCPYNDDKNVTDSLDCFLYITSYSPDAENLRNFYRRLDRIDPIVGLFFEDHEADSPIGPTMARAILREYERKRDADYYFYLNGHFDNETLAYIKNRTMVSLMNDNFGVNITSFFYIMEMPTCPFNTSITVGTASSEESTSSSSSSSVESSKSTSSEPTHGSTTSKDNTSTMSSMTNSTRGTIPNTTSVTVEYTSMDSSMASYITLTLYVLALLFI